MMLKQHCLLLLLLSTLSSARAFEVRGGTIITNALNHGTTRCLLALSASSKSNDSHAETTALPVMEDQVQLPNGVSMQVLSSFPKNSSNKKPVLLFLHGSFHGAWCWKEHYFQYFTSRGYTVVAPSWRGTGGTPALGGENVKKVKIMQHVDDLDGLLHTLPRIFQDRGVSLDRDNYDQDSGALRPVVMCHSFAGLAVMKYVESLNKEQPEQRHSPFRGIVTMCAVPPSGIGKMNMRFIRRSLVASYKITVGFAMKRCLKSTRLCRELFFGGDKIVDDDGETVLEDYGLSDDDVERYQSYFQRDCQATIDLFDLSKQLPSAETDSEGCANFWTDKNIPPCLVMGAKDDYLVDREGLDETARYFGLSQPLIVDSPHDVMVGAKWTNAAEALESWLEDNIVTTTKES